MNDNATALSIIFVLAVLMPLSIGITRSMWRRSAKTTTPPSQDHIESARLERMEQAVDAIAIEVERISEGQRFITKMLAERPAASSNGSGQAAGRRRARRRALPRARRRPHRADRRRRKTARPPVDHPALAWGVGQWGVERGAGG